MGLEPRAQCNTLINGRQPTATSGADLNNNQIRGRYSHAFHVIGRSTDYQRPDKSVSFDKWPGFYKDYRKFLDYVNFAAPNFPTIIFEGKTDASYVEDALRIRHLAFPNLSSGPLAKDRFVKFFRYSRTSHAIQALGGGTGDLKELIYNYNSRMKKFSRAAFTNPIILIVDNDEGSKDIFSAVSKLTKKSISGDDPFYYVTKNLYVLPLPKVNNSDTLIEDLLPPPTKKVVLKGKTFRPHDDGFDDTIHFGKVRLSQYVRKNREDIDFSGFDPLLENLEAAIADYRRRHAT